MLLVVGYFTLFYSFVVYTTSNGRIIVNFEEEEVVICFKFREWTKERPWKYRWSLDQETSLVYPGCSL